MDEIKFQIENVHISDQEAAFILEASALECKSWDPPKVIRNKFNGDIAEVPILKENLETLVMKDEYWTIKL